MITGTDLWEGITGAGVGAAATWSERQQAWFQTLTNPAVVSGAALGAGAIGLMFLQRITPNTEALLRGLFVGGATLLGERVVRMQQAPAAARFVPSPYAAPQGYLPAAAPAARYSAGAVFKEQSYTLR